MPRDHPRVCGEHVQPQLLVCSSSGSSPRVRGTPPACGLQSGEHGIIPACAGNTATACRRQSRTWDHPRVCGEHMFRRKSGNTARINAGIIPACAGNTDIIKTGNPTARDHPRVCGEHEVTPDNIAGYTGSSPRVRGTLSQVVAQFVGVGIIPACAGNTWRETGAQTRHWDHPRVCGEHPSDTGKLVWVPGSSPRVRGTPLFPSSITRLIGIIPACAGNTSGSSSISQPSRDHPRVCGEHVVSPAMVLPYSGSSPRVRGTPPEHDPRRPADGIIPACAGNTASALRTPCSAWDHPRVCGEHRLDDQLEEAMPGSSPRVRGTHGEAAHLADHAGIIPACAGNTLALHRGAHSPRDHPRVCGEHLFTLPAGLEAAGSSPRVRGTRRLVVLTILTLGIIPACAGNT